MPPKPFPPLQDVKLPSISGTVIANSNLNLLGMGATIISLQVGFVCLWAGGWGQGAGVCVGRGVGGWGPQVVLWPHFPPACHTKCCSQGCRPRRPTIPPSRMHCAPGLRCTFCKARFNFSIRIRQVTCSHPSRQAIVGNLVAKTLSSASANAYYGAQRGAAPPVAFDVFSVQVGVVMCGSERVSLLPSLSRIHMGRWSG
jgi:hypothetical protein